MIFLLFLLCLTVGAKLCVDDVDCLRVPDRTLMNKVMEIKEKQWQECSQENHCPNRKAFNEVSEVCVNGMAGEYPCCGIDLLSFINIATLGANGDGNDIWGWTSPSGQEIAMVGLYDGTSFVDVSVPTRPSVLGWLRTQTVGSSWRDIKVYKNYAFIVSEARDHGMQVFDLSQLARKDLQRPFLFPNGTFNLEKPPALAVTALYSQFGSAHNIVINEETGFAYAVGTKTCNGGLHMVDISNPLKPVFAGCFADDGYTHDAQCVVYRGPDVNYVGKEICFCYNEDTLTIVDVTNKASPKQISRTGYVGSQYTHQGWLLSDSSHLLLNDELDELEGSNQHTRTMLWDVSVLSNPTVKTSFYAKDTTIDHNLYVLGDRAFLTNYCDGLRVLDVSGAANKELSQVAYFDVAPDCSTVEFLGSWSNYPYFPSGTIVVSSIERGLFVLKLNGNQNCQ